MGKNSTEIVLYRDGEFQVELFTIRAGAVVPPHRHPNVDTYEVFLHVGEGACARAAHKVSNSGVRWLPAIHPEDPKGRSFFIAHGALHMATNGNEDALVLSVQHWRNGVPPTFITDDWEGPPWE
jgi:hypothetical protein